MRIKYPRHITKSLLFLTTLLIFTSCKLLESPIINNCSSNVQVDIHYDEDLVQYIPRGMDGFYKWIDKSTEDNRSQMIAFDSSNFKASYLLKYSDTLIIKPAIKFLGDTYFLINDISFINDQDTIGVDDLVDPFGFIFIHDSTEYYPFKIEDAYFKELDEETKSY